MSELAERIIHLNGQGKHFGRLEITDGRLLLEVKRGQRHLRFDLLACVKTGRAVYEDVAEGDRQKKHTCAKIALVSGGACGWPNIPLRGNASPA